MRGGGASCASCDLHALQLPFVHLLRFEQTPPKNGGAAALSLRARVS